eukprot:190204-Chlamydomonas_euryale.AAC.6
MGGMDDAGVRATANRVRPGERATAHGVRPRLPRRVRRAATLLSHRAAAKTPTLPVAMRMPGMHRRVQKRLLKRRLRQGGRLWG